jgi:hypothetical protein
MKKIRLLLAVITIAILFLEYIWYVDRSFVYSPDKLNCMTLLENFDSVYVIPGKYWGLFRPTKNYLKGSRQASIRFRWNYAGYKAIFHNDGGWKFVVKLDTLEYKYINYKRNLSDYDSLDYSAIMHMQGVLFREYVFYGKTWVYDQ